MVGVWLVSTGRTRKTVMKTGALLVATGLLLLSCGPIQPTAANNQPSCEDVRYQCAFDSACSEGLKSYFLTCDKLLQADTSKCPEACLFALVALTTTYHGQRLLDVSVISFFYRVRPVERRTRPGIVYRNGVEKLSMGGGGGRTNGSKTNKTGRPALPPEIIPFNNHVRNVEGKIC